MVLVAPAGGHAGGFTAVGKRTGEEMKRREEKGRKGEKGRRHASPRGAYFFRRLFQ
jgi:hypothetical protein